ncbi:ABC transporter substrate-binding protein [Arthrobacter sp. 35W]|uniref:ABC transporter substrate-binding protein n=1 Tax=Arthrobacter sp. 35W TaxID=1132441 RepID=UPI0018CBD289|nr:ABC transporter substrate-binding protein [Arthrobacter sp. 35W]
MKLRYTGTLALLALVGGLLTGCMPATTSGSAKDSQATIALPAEPSNTDPIMTRSIAAWNMYYAMYDGLTRITADGKVVPGLATDWKHNADLSEWEFTIRPGVKFHNGEELKPSDIVYTYSTILGSEKSTNRPAVAMVKSVTAEADNVVKFTLKNPFSAWLNQVATIGIVPQDVYTKEGDNFVNAPVGTGPFKFSAWQRGVSYSLERNGDYWGDKPALDKVTFSFVGAEDARVSGVESGTLNAGAIPPNQVPVLKNSTQATVISSPSNGSVFLGMNSKAAGLEDVRVRQAISLAIDRDEIIKGLMGGLATPNGQLVAKGVTGFVENFPVPTTDIERAKKLLSEAGYTGEPITLEYATVGGFPMSAEIAQAVEGYLSKAGITIKLVGTEQASLSLKMANHKITGLYLNMWTPSSMDGDVVVNQILAGGPEDYAKDPAMAKLYLEQQAAPENQRSDVFKKIWELNRDQAYTVPLFTPSNSYAASPNLAWTPSVDGIYRATGVAFK